VNDRAFVRVFVGVLALLALLSLFVAPWAAINRETGARGTVLVLPNRTYDFTGRTAPVQVPLQEVVLGVGALALLAIAAGGALPDRQRRPLWLGAGAVLVGTVVWGSVAVGQATQGAQFAALLADAQAELADPGRRVDVAALTAVVEDAEALSTVELLGALQGAGLRIRQLPYATTSVGLAAGFSFAVGVLAFLAGLRHFARPRALLNRALAAVAVPATAILLALVAAAVVILALQPTPLGSGVSISGPLMYLAGRLDVLWYAYASLFATSLTDPAGFMEALKFATPLIFTGLAVAFGFRAGLFNIGAPGQMVLGGIFAMIVGVYLPGPRLVVLPLAVLAAALGGGLWGALPGWLKARFGASEVINTILLNYIAASLLLLILSNQQVFAAPVARIFVAVGVFLLVAILLNLIPATRTRMARAPRLSAAVSGVLLLVVMVVVGAPRPGDSPVNLGLPFKAPGSEPKSYELSEAARLPQLPELVGVPPGTFGEAVVPLNLGLVGAPVAALLVWALLGAARRLRPPLRLLLAALAGGLVYMVFGALGLNARPTPIPPTNLNVSFLLALGAAVLMYVILWRTTWGYELRAVGLAPKAAEYGGANISRSVVWAMTVSGAFAGLTASHYVLGGALEDYALRQSLPTSDGFDGIAVALLGQNTPLGVVLSAFLFGVLKNGGSALNITFTDLTRDVVNMILALVVLFIAARGFLPGRLTDPLTSPFRREVSAEPVATPPTPVDPPGRPERRGESL
jgi:general nucleoside transport system permease protein